MESNKQAFVATVVHDLKTPTYAQISTLNMLKNEAFGKLNSEQQEMVTLTQESCRYMSNLIGTIMETYRNDSGNISLNKSEFDVVKLINKTCDETKTLSYAKNQTVIFNSDEKLMIYADKLQIRRVIFNLLSNAITYGFEHTNIEIHIKNNPNSFEFWVTNISKEIPAKELSTIFDKYRKTKYACINNSGTGLGLYLARQIIESHHGRIYAKSSKDGQCSFGFVIPSVMTNQKKCHMNT